MNPATRAAATSDILAGRPSDTGRLVFADAAAADAWAGQHYATRPETGSDLPAAALDQAEIRALAARVAGQADYRLALVSGKYDLSPAQQGLAYPLIVRSTPAYRAAVAEGTLVEEARAADAGVVLEPAGAAEVADADDDFALALDSSLEALEAELAAVLSPEQLAALSEDQLDRYYWWGEVLLRVQEQQEAELEEIVASALGTSTAPATTAAAATAATEPAADVIPAAHQGGNLLDLLNGAP